MAPRALRRTGQILTGLAALLALLGLLVGAPIALAILGGNPLPDQLPTGTQLTDLLLRPDDDGAVFVGALTVIGWIAWAAFAVPILVETIARLRGVRTPRLPALGGPQKIAAGLVAAISLLIASPAVAAGTSTYATPAAPSTSTAATATIAVTAPTVTTPVTQTAEPDREQPATYQVRKGDYLTTISDRLLGDEDRYTEIAELNPSIKNPDLIRPGQQFVLPDDARDHGVRQHATGKVSPPATAEEKAPAPTPPPAADQPAPTATTPAPATTAVQEKPANPAQPAASAPADTAAPTVDAAAPQTAADDEDLVVPVASAVAGLGVFAALSLLALRRRRARQQQHRRPRRRIAQPVAGETEAKLRVAAAPTDLDRLDAALRALAGALTDRPDEQWPDVVAAWVEPDAIHLVLTEACTGPPPAPWHSDNATIWTLSAKAPLPEADDQLAPLPTLVALGSQTGQQLLVDLERLGMITVGGDQDRALDLLRYIAGELAHNVWSDEVYVTLAGFDPDEAALLAQLNAHRITVAQSVEEAIATLRRRLADTRDALSAAGASNTVVGRGIDNGEAWVPHVLLIAQPTSEQQALLADLEQDLAAAASTGYAVVVTGADQQPGRWPVTVSADGQLNVAFLTDTPLTASALPAAMLQPLVDLLSTADVVDDQPTPPAPDTEEWATGTDAGGGLQEPERVGGMDDMFGSDDDAEDEQQPDASDTETTSAVTAPVSLPTRPVSAVTSWHVTPTASTLHTLHPSVTDIDPQAAQQRRRDREERDPHLDADLAAWTDGDTTRPRIGILGPVQIDAPGRRPKDRHRFYGEFIVYLASRGARGSTAAQLEDAIWREQKASSNSRRQAVSNARTWLGAAPDGTPWMPHMTDQLYHLTDGYLFDWVLFRRLRARGEARGTDGAADLRAALNLVRGAPFDGVQDSYTAERTPYAWLPDSEIAPTHLVAAIVDTAHQLVDLSLAADDLPGARWAVERAWLADPQRNEDQPWRDAMRLAHTENRDAELKALLHDLMRHRDAECDEDLDPHTYRLVRQLVPYPNSLAS